MVKVSFDFWISRHFVTIFRNIRTFEDTISPKVIELSQTFFTFVSITSRSFKIIYFYAMSWNFNFAVNLVTSFLHQKQLKSKNKKHRIFWNTEFYHPAKFELKRIKNAKAVPSLQLFACILAQREKISFASVNIIIIIIFIIIVIVIFIVIVVIVVFIDIFMVILWLLSSLLLFVS